MEKMMKQMGINTKKVDATEVIIKCSDKDIVISNPEITVIQMQGKNTYQVVGDESEKEKEKFSKDDINMIKEQTGASEDEIKTSLEKTNDIAESILELKK